MNLDDEILKIFAESNDSNVQTFEIYQVMKPLGIDESYIDKSLSLLEYRELIIEVGRNYKPIYKITPKGKDIYHRSSVKKFLDNKEREEKMYRPKNKYIRYVSENPLISNLIIALFAFVLGMLVKC